MPFDFVSYKAKCDTLSTEELQLEWQKYTRQLSTGVTMTASSAILSPLTSGISLIGLGISVPQLHNARKKRNIVGNKMHSYGTEPHTRRRDIIGPSAISLTTAGLTCGIPPSVVVIAGAEAGSKGIEYLVSHVTLDALWYILDEAQSICHHRRSKRKLKQLQEKQEQHLAQVEKIGECPQIGLDVVKPIFEESWPSSIRAEYLRAYYLGDNDNYDEPDTPTHDPEKYVYEGGQVKVAYNSRPNSYLESLNRRDSQLPSQRLNYINIDFPSDEKSYLHSTTASKKSWTSEHYCRSLSRPVTPSSPAMMELVPHLQAEEKNAEDYDLESEPEVENESDEEEEDEEDEEDEDEEEEIIRDKNVIKCTLTLEQEVAMLKATILRMEMERRGLVSPSENLGNPNQVQGNVSPVSLGITVKSTESAKNKSGPPSTGSAILSKITRKLGTDQSLAQRYYQKLLGD